MYKKTLHNNYARYMYVTRFELAAFWSVARRSIQLSYTYLDVNTSMPATGIEPVWEYKSRRILSPVRLPVPPHRLGVLLIIAIIMIAATRMGFEPTTSAVTGRRSNQLSHQAIISRIKRKWTFGDSNPGPTGYEPVALTN